MLLELFSYIFNQQSLNLSSILTTYAKQNVYGVSIIDDHITFGGLM